MFRLPFPRTGLDVAESSLASTNGQESNGLVDPPEGRDIDGLPPDGTGGADSGGVFAGTAVEDSVDSNLDGVLVGDEVDDLESVLNNAGGLDLLAVVAAVHHERVGETLNDGALGLPEPLDGIAAGRVGEVDRAELDVVAISPTVRTLFHLILQQFPSISSAMLPPPPPGDYGTYTSDISLDASTPSNDHLLKSLTVRASARTSLGMVLKLAGATSTSPLSDMLMERSSDVKAS